MFRGPPSLVTNCLRLDKPEWGTLIINISGKPVTAKKIESKSPFGITPCSLINRKLVGHLLK